jgi:hypothetical protein
MQFLRFKSTPWSQTFEDRSRPALEFRPACGSTPTAQIRKVGAPGYFLAFPHDG